MFTLMKVLLTIALFLSFLSVAVFGFLAINHGGDEHNACIAAIAEKCLVWRKRVCFH